MAEIRYREALNAALREEMERGGKAESSANETASSMRSVTALSSSSKLTSSRSAKFGIGSFSR